MTYQQAVALFKAGVLPEIVAQYEADGVKDIFARREAWNNWTDGLHQDGHITDEQVDNWVSPW